MNLPTTPLSNSAPPDQDLAEQARPGHGVPSQDPDPAAQVALKPEEAEREGKSAIAGGSLLAGVAIGATIGVAVAGPLGVLGGGALGAVAGAGGGAAVGTVMNSENASRADAALEGAADELGDDRVINSVVKP